MEKKGQPGVCRGEAPTPGTSAKPAPTSHQQLEPGKRRGVTLALRFLPLHLDKVGVGAKTSGSGECPFGDVRSPSTAPPVPPQLPRARCLRGARPRRPTYTQVRGTCSPAPADSPPSSLGCTAAGGPGARKLLGATP